MNEPRRDSKPTFTVCICTRNRVEYLGPTIESVLAQALSLGEFDILVVDNGSTDGTSEMVTSRFGANTKVPVRCIREEKPGLSRARNRALAETTSDFLVYMDDDALPEPGWLSFLAEAFAGAPDVAVVGGAVVPVYEGGRPAWLSAEVERIFAPQIAGEGRRRIFFPDYPYGVNIAFRTSVFSRIGGFREDLGYVLSKLIPCDETELLMRAENAGEVMLFEPRAIVRHLIPRSRLTKGYLRRRFMAAGKGCHEVEKVRQGDAAVWGFREILNGAARSLGRGIVAQMRRLAARWAGGAEGFSRELKLSQDLGWHGAEIEEAWSQLRQRIRACVRPAHVE